MKAIDTHCHVQMAQYDRDRDEVISHASTAGVGMICVGVDLNSSRKAIELSAGHEGMWASAGLHPNDNLNEDYNNDEYAILARNEKVVAIGEIGLDYYRTVDEKKKAFQKMRFLKQLQLASDSKKPLIIHCRDAHVDMQQILDSFNGKLFGGVIHSFTGTWQQAERYIRLGFYLGLNGIVTFSKEYDDLVYRVPVDKLLLETDAPYLAPPPYRGKRNEPAYVLEIARHVAGVKNLEVDKLLEQTLQNSQSLFGLEI